MDDGVVPVTAHKFFETDLPFGLVTFVDIAKMVGVATPLMEAIIVWNQKLIGKEYLKEGGAASAEGHLEYGSDIGECVVPSLMGLDISTITKGMAEQPAKKQKV